MPRRKQRSYEDRLDDMLIAEITGGSDRMAAEQGPPSGRRLSESEHVRLWGLRDPAVQYDSIVASLLAEGMGDEAASQLKVVQENPGVLKAYSGPAVTHEAAQALAVLAEYPYRVGIWNVYGDPHDRVDTANHINGLWQKQSGQQAGVGPTEDANVALEAEPLPAAPTGYQPALPPAPEMPAPAPPTPPVNGAEGY